MTTPIPVNDLSRIDPHELKEVVHRIETVIASGRYFFGPETTRLLDSISQIHDNRSVIGVGNGTDALFIAVVALDLPANSKIVTVPNAGGYSSNAILRAGHKPIYCDINPESAQMDPGALLQLLDHESDIKAVIFTHLYGLTSDITASIELCRHRQIRTIEDCAQSIGCRRQGTRSGVLADFGTFSFYPTKNLGGMGDGGAILTANNDLLQRATQLAQYGWSERYRVDHQLGINSRLDEIQAAILNCRLEKLDNDNLVRRSIVSRYQECLQSGRKMIYEDSEAFIGHLAILVTPHRDSDRNTLENQGISTAIHYPILDYQQNAWRNVVSKSSCPNAETFVEQILTIPCFPTMREDEVLKVCDALSGLQ